AVLGGKDNRIALDGFAPFTAGVLLDGDPMQLALGRAHLALGAGTTDVNGYLAISITPRLREPPTVGALVTSGVTILIQVNNATQRCEVTETPTRHKGSNDRASCSSRRRGLFLPDSWRRSMIDDLGLPVLILSNQPWQIVVAQGNQLVLRREADGALKTITTEALIKRPAALHWKPSRRDQLPRRQTP
ncbi:MAG: hypothetical protein GYB68_05245, partial [Chloroflexi bacterium]|nr:hypothetical protein [Chloroflexota bacterium]